MKAAFAPVQRLLQSAIVAAAVSLCLLAAATGDDAARPETVLAPGYEPLKFEPPEPGSYSLPIIREAPDGMLLTSAGDTVSLHELMAGRISVVGFIYLNCGDVNGCPLALYVMKGVERKLKESFPGLHARVRFLSISFDPERDTPAALREHQRHFVSNETDWLFLTGASVTSLEPVLEAYGQAVVPEVDETGQTTGQLSHVLRVFLIDPELHIRNIYSTAFLHAETLVNDIRSLGPESTSRLDGIEVASGLFEPGDNRTGYDSAAYRTQSISLEERTGQAADLLALIQSPTPGLPSVPVPVHNPPTRQKIQLGRKLFYDRRLSHNGTISCAMCHIPEQGFGSTEMTTAIGIQGRSVRRNAPTLFNVGYQTALFHDGRETTLEQQIWGPLLASNEMGNPAVGVVLERLRDLPEYEPLFESAFGVRGISMETVGMALASYERALVSGDSAFDRWYYEGDESAVTESAKNGFALFTGKAGCASCHLVGEDHALFTDGDFHNTGIGYRAAFEDQPAAPQMIVAPGEVIRLAPGTTEYRKPNDLGRYEVTLRPEDRWRYRTPTLRNIALTSPYMHDGSMRSLEDVIHYYDGGGHPNSGLDPAIRRLQLTESEIRDLEAFLRALTGSNVRELIADAYAAPVGG